MSGHDIIVIGGSAGALEPLRTLLLALPADLRAAIFVVLHLPPSRSASVPAPLQKATTMEVRFAAGDEAITHGRVLLAPPDHHLTLLDRGVHLSRGPRENYWRPAIDVLFRTAAVAAGPRVVGVLLSGALDDGVAGLQAIRRCKGKVLVQSPEEAPFPEMPELARRTVDGARTLPVHEIAAELVRLTRTAPEPASEPPADLKMEARLAMHPTQANAQAAFEQGEPSSHTCPECNGPLSRARDGLERFRCQVGHSYSAESLSRSTRREIEAGLWAAIRLLQQRATLSRAAAQREHERGRDRGAALYAERAEESEAQAALLRELLLSLSDEAATASLAAV